MRGGLLPHEAPGLLREVPGGLVDVLLVILDVLTSNLLEDVERLVLGEIEDQRGAIGANQSCVDQERTGQSYIN